jgi:hypothetical protein
MATGGAPRPSVRRAAAQIYTPFHAASGQFVRAVALWRLAGSMVSCCDLSVKSVSRCGFVSLAHVV